MQEAVVAFYNSFCKKDPEWSDEWLRCFKKSHNIKFKALILVLAIQKQVLSNMPLIKYEIL